MATYTDDEVKKLEVKAKLSPKPKYTDDDVAKMEVSGSTPTTRGMERVGTLGNIPTNAEIRPSSWYEGFIGDVLRGIARGSAIAKGAATGAEITPGGAIPKFAGAVAGGIVGNTGYQALQEGGRRLGNSRVLGAPPTDVKSALTESVMETALELGGGKLMEWLGSGMKGVKPFDAMKRSLLGAPTLDPDMAAAMKAHPDIDLPVSSTTGSDRAFTAEGIFSPLKAEEMIIEAEKKLGGKVKGTVAAAIGQTPKVSAAQTAGEMAVKSYNDLRTKVLRQGSDLYETFKETAIKNGDVETVIKQTPQDTTRLDSNGQPFVDPFASPTKTETIELAAPIYLRNTSSGAAKISELSKSIINDLKQANVPPEAYTGFEKLVEQLKPLAEPEFTTMAKGTPVLSWEQWKGIRSAARRVASRISRADAPESQKALKTILGGNDDNSGFVGSLTKDKVESMSLWKPETRAELEAADKFHEALARRWPQSDPMFKRLEDQGMLVKGGRKAEDIPFETLINEALKDPVTARNFAKMTGTRKPLAGAFIERAFNAARTILPDGREYWNGQKVLQYMTDNAATMNSVSNSQQRQDWKHLANVMSRVPPEPSRTGRTSWMLYQGVTGVNVAAGSANAASRGMALLGFIPFSHLIAEKYLLNPGKARQLAALMETPPGTPRHNWLSRSFLEGGKNLIIRPMHDDSAMPISNLPIIDQAYTNAPPEQ